MSVKFQAHVSNVSKVMIVRGMMGQMWFNCGKLKSGYYPGVSEKSTV